MTAQQQLTTVALISEPECIGCSKCIKVCPVDAILGSQGKMHTIIASECIGCKLCLPPCPVDCISLLTIATPPLSPNAKLHQTRKIKQRYRARQQRLASQASVAGSLKAKQAYIKQAVIRARQAKIKQEK